MNIGFLINQQQFNQTFLCFRYSISTEITFPFKQIKA